MILFFNKTFLNINNVSLYAFCSSYFIFISVIIRKSILHIALNIQLQHFLSSKSKKAL